VSGIVRLGAVSYLNVRPLVYGLSERPGVSLRFDVPSFCARLLADGEIDLGMVPSVTYLDRPGDRIVPGVCIGSEGPVASVALFTRKPIADVRSIALDSSSRTSAMLTRILCKRLFHIAPTFVPHGPDLDSMLAAADAALLIGDPALFADPSTHRALKIDLGAEWTSMTRLPFVWAFWSGRAGAGNASVIGILNEAAAIGRANTDDVADDYCAGDHARQAIARDYLRVNMRFNFDDRAIEGLRTYYREAAALGLVAERSLDWFPS
jgi:predicted solute-binding protein